MFNNIYQGKRVLVTGHTGFKGSWLSFWLKQLGADVAGYALEPATNPNHFDLLKLDIRSQIGDIRDKEKLEKFFKVFKPEIVFHLAAQPLVRYSYEQPEETYEVNVMGTLNVFENCRKSESVKAIINVTSDKCYENKEWVWGYRENDPMGGYDPYSSSKGCSEILTMSYRNSFFNLEKYKKNHQILLASCRAGNVIGGGDWSDDRLIPDIIKSAIKDEKVYIRNPYATRPWQHVLEPLSGYLMVGQKLLEEKKEFADAWNFGPEDEGSITVEDLVKRLNKFWDKVKYEIKKDQNQPHEANLLKLDCSKAHIKLGWKNVWNSEETFEQTIVWYRDYYSTNNMKTLENLNSYINNAQHKQISWACK